MSLSSRLDRLEARGDAFVGRDGVVLILPCKNDSGYPECSWQVIRPDWDVRMPWFSTIVTPDQMHLYPELFRNIESTDRDVAGWVVNSQCRYEIIDNPRDRD
jgi:hypothetical protein